MASPARMIYKEHLEQWLDTILDEVSAFKLFALV